ncbi:MAG: sugar-transfer associated ATP-grasp domain-containing protein [Marinibacterium sp.]
MTATDVETPTSALLEPPKFPGAPKAEKIVAVARKYNVSPFRQLKEWTALAFGPCRLPNNEYYNQCLYLPSLSMREKKQFVGVKGSWKLNTAVSPKALTGVQGFVANKFMYTSLIRQLGFRTTETQAVVSNMRRFGTTPCLDTPTKLRRFLLEDARYPLFGKPQSYSGSFGSALIDRIDGEEIVLGNGLRMGLDAFCDEIVQEYGEGYLLQSAIRQHPDLSDIIGRAIGTIRLVTIREEIMPRVFYALWKIPAPRAMSDNFWQDGSMIAQIDHQTGMVGETWIGSGLDARTIETHPVSGKAFAGTQLPDWEEACEMARQAHALFPEFGVIGWDVSFSEDGPLLIECNDNPFHSLYQNAYRRGIWNDDFRPVLERTIALSKKLLDEKNARIKKRNDDRKRK